MTHPCEPVLDERAAKEQARALWESDRVTLLVEFPFLALLAVHLEIVPVVDARVATASTDGRHVFVNPYFLLARSAADRRFVLAHEVMHCALSHFTRSTADDVERWNIAFDHEANGVLAELGLELPADALHFESLRGVSAEEVYAHLRWDGTFAREARPGCRGALADQHPCEVGEAADEESDPDYQPLASADAWERWREILSDAGRRRADTCDLLPAQLRVRAMAEAAPQVPWRSVLAHFAESVSRASRSWLPPSRRHVWRGLYLPSQRTRRLDLAVAIDTSGSTTEVLHCFLAELESIARSFGDYRIRVLQCDFEVTSDATFGPERPFVARSIEARGGRATSFAPIFEHVASTEGPQALVYFTDGFGRAPKEAPAYPVLWALPPHGEKPCAWGSVLRIAGARGFES